MFASSRRDDLQDVSRQLVEERSSHRFAHRLDLRCFTMHADKQEVTHRNDEGDLVGHMLAPRTFLKNYTPQVLQWFEDLTK